MYRKTLIILFAFLFSIQLLLAQSTTKIDLSLRNATLKEFLSAIEKQTDYTFMYNSIDISKEKDLNVNIKQLTVEEILRQVLPRKIRYEIVGSQIILKEESDGEPGTPVQAANVKITGNVADEQGEPLIGVSVILEGSSTGIVTDMDGNFTINIANDNSRLKFSYVGYIAQVITIGKQRNLSVVMKEDTKALDEVVVIGYGTQSAKFVTTSISKVKMDNIDKGGDYDPIKMLQGRVAGVNITNSSGTPGSTPSIFVRGIGSISGSSSPLYVVDGIPSEKYPNLNPNDIESMEVLKDASAAAIYGSRANAGVVLINTKSGKSGVTKVEVSGQYGMGSIARDIKMANTQEYLQTMRAAIDNYNTQMGTSLELYVPSSMNNTNWVDQIARDQSDMYNASVSISGGNDKTTFFTSLGANGQEGYLKKTSFDQYNFRAKFSHKISPIFKLNMNLSGSAGKYSYLEEESTSLKVLRTAREEQPWASPYREDGSYSVNSTELVRHNPAMLVNEETWTLGKYQGSGIVNLEVTPFSGFKYTPSVSVYGVFDKEKKKLTEKHDARARSAGWAALSQQKDVSTRYVIDNLFTYDNSWDKLRYNALLGHSFEKYAYERFGAMSDNYANDAYPSSSFDVINAGANIYAGNISYQSYALESYFGRIMLNWDNKYVFNASLRSDGSSRFSKNKRYGYFPSASFAWLVSEEKFFPKNDKLNELKLRLSWGKTGSMAGIGNYAPLSLVTSGGGSYNGSSGFQLSQDAQELTWEKANQFNAGVDLAFFDSRISLTADAFYQKTTDLLFEKPVVATTGYSKIQSNIGSLENRGLEFTLTGKVLTGAFKWNLSGNISFVDNKLLSLVDDTDMYIVPSSGSNLLGGSMHALINGKPISAFYMYKMEGIYQRDEDVPSKLYAKGVRAGDVKYYDRNDDGDISEDDRVYVGKAVPDFYGGITSDMSFKGFDLSITGGFSHGGKIMASWRGANGVEGAEHLGLAYGNTKPDGINTVEQFFNISKEAATGYWRGEGTSNTMPRPVRGGVHTGYTYGYNTLASTRYLEDASYFKIKLITLGYTLPEKWIQKAGIAYARVYMTANNVLTFTKYSGYDPEASFNLNPGNSNYGVDFGLQPTLRTFIFGLNLHF